MDIESMDIPSDEDVRRLTEAIKLADEWRRLPDTRRGH
jgi:hypothetical protein